MFKISTFNRNQKLRLKKGLNLTYKSSYTGIHWKNCPAICESKLAASGWTPDTVSYPDWSHGTCILKLSIWVYMSLINELFIISSSYCYSLAAESSSSPIRGILLVCKLIYFLIFSSVLSSKPKSTERPRMSLRII